MSPPVVRPWSSWAPMNFGWGQPRKRSRTESDPFAWMDTPLLVSDRLEDWLLPETDQHQGLLCRRQQTWGDIQAAVDAAVASGAFGREHAVTTSVHPSLDGWFGDFGSAAEELVAQVGCLPDEIASVIAEDARQIGRMLTQLCPWAPRIDVKLEIMGVSSCSRWHTDTYGGRAIVSYNCSATDYTPQSNADMWELENCGNNECIIRDKSKIYSVEVGDMLFIKGNLFPGRVNGLVHKSPEKRYKPSGDVVNRLLLKIDVPKP